MSVSCGDMPHRGHAVYRVENYAIRFRRRNLGAVWFLTQLSNKKTHHTTKSLNSMAILVPCLIYLLSEALKLPQIVNVQIFQALGIDLP